MPASLVAIASYFNPLPRKEGDWHSCRKKLLKGNFNPLPRKEGDDICPISQFMI